MRRKQILWLMMSEMGIIAGFSIGYLMGASHVISTTAKCDVFTQSIILRSLEAGNTSKAAHFLEASLVDSVNRLQWAKQNPVAHVFKKWNWEAPSGEHWDFERKWATERTQKARDQMIYYTQHPEELKKEFEQKVGTRPVDPSR